MKIPAEEKLQILAERRGWSVARAQGYVEGETARRRGEVPSPYRLVAIDDYALGFRAGYFERHNPRRITSTYSRYCAVSFAIGISSTSRLLVPGPSSDTIELYITNVTALDPSPPTPLPGGEGSVERNRTVVQFRNYQ